VPSSIDAPAPQGQAPPARPSHLRKIAALYLDLSLSALLSWDMATAVGAREALFIPLTLMILVGMRIWFLDRIRPTPGEGAMGIRYLTSKSSQVVAEIQVLDRRHRLNAPLLLAGVLEATLAFAGLASWTVLDRAVLLGRVVDAPLAFLTLLAAAAVQMTAAFHVLSGSRAALSRVPAAHAVLILLAAPSLDAWPSVLPAPFASLVRPFFAAYVAWSVLLGLILFLSRSRLGTHPGR